MDTQNNNWMDKKSKLEMLQDQSDKIGHIIIITKWHITSSPISAEDYHGNEMVKVNKHQKEEKLNEFTDRFVKIHNSVNT